MELIRLEKITKRYGSKQILNEISLSVEEGQFIAIIGESGVGKSTLLNLIGLLEFPDSGDYFLAGNHLNWHDFYLLSQLRSTLFGFVFQLFYLIPNLSVSENVMLPYVYSPFPRKDVRGWIFDLAMSLGIEPLLHEKVDYLSGGEKQRVALARALVNEPKVLICDEPTGNLDQKNAKIVIDLLRNETKKGRAVILVTHDERVAQNADITYSLNHFGELTRDE